MRDPFKKWKIRLSIQLSSSIQSVGVARTGCTGCDRCSDQVITVNKSMATQPLLGKAVTAIALIGVGGAVLSKDPAVIVDVLGRIVRSVTQVTSGSHQTSDAALDVLAGRSLKLLGDRLDRLESTRERIMMVPGSGGASGSSISGVTGLFVLCLSGGGIYYVYTSGMKFATRENLQSAVDVLTSTVSQLRDNVHGMIGDVQHTQDDLLHQQDMLQDSVSEVSENVNMVKQSVNEVKGDVKQIRNVVHDCEEYLIEHTKHQQITSHGMRLLCGVLSDSLPHESRAKRELEDFIGAIPQNGLPAIANGSEPSTPRRRKSRPSFNRRLSWNSPSGASSNNTRPARGNTSESDSEVHWMSGAKPEPRSHSSPRLSQYEDRSVRIEDPYDSEVPPPSRDD